MWLSGCSNGAALPATAIRALPSQPATPLLQPYFPEIAKSHVALTFAFDPVSGATDPELLLSPTLEARWLIGYLGAKPASGAAPAPDDPLRLPIPMSRRVPLRNSLLATELWLAHVESLYVQNYIAAGRPGVKLRYSPWVERHGLSDWKLGLPAIEPLQQPRLVSIDGQYLPTGSNLDLALRDAPGVVTFFGVINEAGMLVGLTRDGRLYLDANRRLSTPYGLLDGLQQALIPVDAVGVTITTVGNLTGLASPEQQDPFSFGPVRLYCLPEAMAEGLVEIDGVYSLPQQPLPSPVTPTEYPNTLLIGRREQAYWTSSWFYRNLRSISEARALVHTALQRLDEALILDQTTAPPPKIVVKSDIAPFQKIFQEWADSQSGSRRRPPLRFRHEKRMILSRAFFTARKAPIRADGDDILLEFPPPDLNSNRSPAEQTAQLLADCAKYLRARMTVAAENLAHVYDIVETVQVGAEKKPRQDRMPRVISLDENTGAFENLPLEKPFRTRVMPGNPNAIDAQGTVYFPNVNPTDEIAEYRNLEIEYKFIQKALVVVQPELLLEDPPPLIVPTKPADWTE